MQINFNHLYYFWQVVRLGGISPAAEALHLTPQTISGQIKQFQSQFSERLLIKSGRQLKLSFLGERVFDHAESMFGSMDDLTRLMSASPSNARRRMRIGAADSLPKLTVRSLLEPALTMTPRPLLSVKEVGLSDLLEDLAYRRLDAVISDRPASSAGDSRLNSTLVLSSGLGIFATAELVPSAPRDFPTLLDGLPAILPPPSSYARRLLDQWFFAKGLHPEVIAEMEDSALIKSFAQKGFGFFAAPIEQAQVISSQYQVEMIGVCDGVEERFYVITLDNAPGNLLVKKWLGLLECDAG